MTTSPKPLAHDLLLANEQHVIRRIDRPELEQRYLELVAITLSIQESTKALVGTLLLKGMK
jgi:hypothetical protein